MKMIIFIILVALIGSTETWSADKVLVSESSKKLTTFQKRNHSLGVRYKSINMGDAKMYRVGDIDLTNAKITYNTTSDNEINLKGLEFSYQYLWPIETRLNYTTNVSFTTSLDEPDLPLQEKQYYSFELFAMYVEAIVLQRVGYEFSFANSQVEIFGSFGVGYSVLKIIENWKEQEGSSGDSVDLKSHARKLIKKVQAGVDYRVNAKWSVNFTAEYTHFKTDRYHTTLYSYWTCTKVTGENDTDLDSDSTGNFSSSSLSLGLAYNF